MKRILLVITIIGILGLVGFYFFQKSGGVQEVELIGVEKITFSKVIPFPALKLQASANLLLKNPNPIGAEITHIHMDIFVTDKHATTIHQDIRVSMPANAEFKLPVNFDIPLGKSGFFKNAKDILNGAWKNQAIDIRTEGKVTVEVLKVAFDIPFDEENNYLLKDYLPK